MRFWKRKSKLAGRVFAILRLRPTIDKEEPSHKLELTNGFAGHDHSDSLRTAVSPLLPISMINLAATPSHADPTIAELDTFPSLSSDSISSSDDLAHQAHYQRYEADCSH